MKNFLIIVFVIGILVGLYYFVRSVKTDVVDPNVQFACNEKLATMRFASEKARNNFYQECVKGLH